MRKLKRKKIVQSTQVKQGLPTRIARQWRLLSKPLYARWQNFSKFKQRWVQGIVIGCFVELMIHLLAHTFHVQKIVALQNYGMDVVNRHYVEQCAYEMGAVRTSLLADLVCKEKSQNQAATVLVAIDDSTHANVDWGGGNPIRAPRIALSKVVRNTLFAGAQIVVVDLLIEDQMFESGPGVDELARVARSEDEQFAASLETLVSQLNSKQQSNKMAENWHVVFARTYKANGGYVPKLKVSSAIDRLIALYPKHFSMAVPAYRAATDRITREWELFTLVCKLNAGKAKLGGTLTAVPSVQLAVAALTKSLQLPSIDPSQSKSCANAVLTTEIQSEQVKFEQKIELARATSQYSDALTPIIAVQKESIKNSNTEKLTESLGSKIIFTLPTEKITTFSAIDFVKEGSNRFAQQLKGATVVVGSTYAGSGDEFTTAIGPMPGPSLLINSIHSLRDFGALQPPPTLLVFTLSLILIVAIAFVSAKYREKRAVVLSVILVLVTAGFASVIYFSHGVWLDFVAPLIAIQAHRTFSNLKKA